MIQRLYRRRTPGYLEVDSPFFHQNISFTIFLPFFRFTGMALVENPTDGSLS